MAAGFYGVSAGGFLSDLNGVAAQCAGRHCSIRMVFVAIHIQRIDLAVGNVWSAVFKALLSGGLVHRENPRPMDVVMNGWLRLP